MEYRVTLQTRFGGRMYWDGDGWSTEPSGVFDSEDALPVTVCGLAYRHRDTELIAAPGCMPRADEAPTGAGKVEG